MKASNPLYSRYVLLVLTATYTCSYLDRYVLSVLVEPIKADLGITDTQLGLLGGFAFALLYTLAGIPIARWADRGNRRNIVALGLTAWSAMTVACGFVKSFPQLLLARVGVGLGEAGCTPPSLSLIADYFPPSRRAMALSIYGMGIPIGVMLGFLAGGWISHYFDWRTAFIVVGLPGLLLALLVRFTVAEPERSGLDGANVDNGEYSLKQAIGFLVANRPLLLLQLGGAFYALAGYGLSFWVAPFFSRVHQLSLQEMATWLAFGAFFGGVGGAWCSGRLADYLGRRGLFWYIMTPVFALCVGVPVTLLMLNASAPGAALALFVGQQFAFSCYSGPMYAAMQFMVPAKMRALIVAIHLFILNLIGLGLGPLVIGVMNDAFITAHGEADSIRFSLMIVAGGSLLGVVLMARAAFMVRGKMVLSAANGSAASATRM